jgi:GNAT superfamily N-acetyltransferase
MSMVTRECWRKQGAASLLISWGVQRAREDGVPAFLEASTAGKPVYEKAGFRQVGDSVPWDMRPYGIDVVFDIAKMAYYPERPE